MQDYYKKLKLSKLFYISPTLLPIPSPVSPRDFPIFSFLEKDILTNGFDSKRPIIVRIGTFNKVSSKVLSEFPRFPSATSIEKLLDEGIENKWKTDIPSKNIADGNHRLVIALELKLDYVPVRFQYIIYD